ncbi:GGDEF domain-containing protein [Teredinibacter haidensis]|uniref:GGDEF domain-containing protein n=1 Tax=Teredinibacter haidensis TaxID=2731755 RepID=UPI0009491D89|nr:GGDEF domain-containing protein [Teredinibacter haidensis]
MSETDSKNLSTLECPKGEESCPILSELIQLRETVEQLKQEAHTDALTGLYNNRHFQLALQQEMERTQRTGQPTTLLLLDLDHFKRINDTWGHIAGDEVLKQTANMLQKSIRKLDIPCRYGGEEFAILLPSTPLLIATQVAERLRIMITSNVISHKGIDIPVSASIGADTFISSKAESPQAFVARVDTWLYKAKHEGRNCVRHGKIQDEHKSRQMVSTEEKSALNDLFEPPS